MSEIKKLNLTFEQIVLKRREEKKKVPLVCLKSEICNTESNSSLLTVKKKLQFQFKTYICSQHVHIYLQ